MIQKLVRIQNQFMKKINSLCIYKVKHLIIAQSNQIP
jgi:hypothetical protein